MKVLLAILRWWHSLWELDWGRTSAIDSHKWESKIECRRRLSYEP